MSLTTVFDWYCSESTLSNDDTLKIGSANCAPRSLLLVEAALDADEEFVEAAAALEADEEFARKLEVE